jgi:hypothetical protein
VVERTLTNFSMMFAITPIVFLSPILARQPRLKFHAIFQTLSAKNQLNPQYAHITTRYRHPFYFFMDFIMRLSARSLLLADSLSVFFFFVIR